MLSPLPPGFHRKFSTKWGLSPPPPGQSPVYASEKLLYIEFYLKAKTELRKF